MQEGSRGGMHCDALSNIGDIECVECLHGRLRLAMDVTEGREIVSADEMRGSGSHGRDVERLRSPPYETLLMGKRRPATQDPIFVGATDAGKARVEVGRNLPDGQHRYRRSCELEPSIQRFHQAERRERPFEFHMRGHGAGMHAGVSSPGGMDHDFFAADFVGGRFQRLLNGRAMRLPLPTHEGAAIIFDRQPEALQRASPGESRLPRSQSAAAIRGLPSGCTISKEIAPSPVAICVP